MLYNGCIFFALIVACFISIKAIVSSFFCCSLFDGKATVCVIGGSLVGIIISFIFSQMSLKAGFFGMGIGIGIAFILAYSGIVKYLIGLIPVRIRRIIRNVFNVIKVALCTIVIIAVIYAVLSMIL